MHQILQWHHMVSSQACCSPSTLSGLEENTLADGIFHTAAFVVLVAGIALLVGRRVEGRVLVGLGLVGWGLFNLVDQFVFHLALGAHHIRMDAENPEVYDWAFAALGLVLIAAGWAVARSAPPAEPRDAVAEAR